MEDDHNTNYDYWRVNPVHVIFCVPCLLLLVVLALVSVHDSGREGGVNDATNYIAAKCDQKNEFKVHTGLTTFYFQCNKVKDVPVTPWDNVDTDKPFQP